MLAVNHRRRVPPLLVDTALLLGTQTTHAAGTRSATLFTTVTTPSDGGVVRATPTRRQNGGCEATSVTPVGSGAGYRNGMVESDGLVTADGRRGSYFSYSVRYSRYYCSWTNVAGADVSFGPPPHRPHIWPFATSVI